MSKVKSEKPFVIRGFDRSREDTFDALGTMEKFCSFKESVVDKQYEAIIEMMSNSTFSTLSTRSIILDQPHQFPIKADDTKELTIIDLKFISKFEDIEDFRPYRTGLRTVLKAWAEKSRVKGRRGWRLSAIKTPTVKFDPKEKAVVVSTQVILSTAVFYNDTTVTVNVNFNEPQEQEDLKNLLRALREHADSDAWMTSMKYKHTEIGDGEVF